MSTELMVLSLLSAFTGFAMGWAMARALLHHPVSERRLPNNFALPRGAHHAAVPSAFIDGYYGGAWFVEQDLGEHTCIKVWSRFARDAVVGDTPAERSYALGWMQAVRPYWQAANGFDVSVVPQINRAYDNAKPTGL